MVWLTVILSMVAVRVLALNLVSWSGRESRVVRKLLRFSFSVRRESRSFIRDCLFKTVSSFSCFRVSCFRLNSSFLPKTISYSWVRLRRFFSIWLICSAVVLISLSSLLLESFRSIRASLRAYFAFISVFWAKAG